MQHNAARNLRLSDGGLQKVACHATAAPQAFFLSLYCNKEFINVYLKTNASGMPFASKISYLVSEFHYSTEKVFCANSSMHLSIARTA